MVLRLTRKRWLVLALVLGSAIASPFIYRIFWTDYSERALVAAALAEQVELKRQIEAELLQGKFAVALPTVERTPRYTRVVDASGTIVMHLAVINTTVVLTPSVNGNEVQWSCSGDVMRNLVAHCRHPLADSILPLVKRAKVTEQPRR